MLKPYDELRKVDVRPYVKKRDNADYLPWGACVDLLHKNGASLVYWTPLTTDNGSSLFMSAERFVNNKDQKNRCYEVRIRIKVDDDEFDASYPVITGNISLRDDTINQQRVYTAQARCFVKAIAIRYGLGFDLWLDDADIDDQPEDLSKHSLAAIKQRMQEEYTRLLRKRMSTKDIADAVGMTEDEVKTVFTYFDQLERFEKKLLSL